MVAGRVADRLTAADVEHLSLTGRVTDPLTIAPTYGSPVDSVLNGKDGRLAMAGTFNAKSFSVKKSVSESYPPKALAGQDESSGMAQVPCGDIEG